MTNYYVYVLSFKDTMQEYSCLAVCPNGAPLVMCLRNMCDDNVSCPAYPEAKCRMNYCGHCSVEFVLPNGMIANCGKQGEWCRFFFEMEGLALSGPGTRKSGQKEIMVPIFSIILKLGYGPTCRRFYLKG